MDVLGYFEYVNFVFELFIGYELMDVKGDMFFCFKIEYSDLE